MFYIAAICPEQINEKVLACKKWLKERFGAIHALKSPAHITLVPPFWWEDMKVDLLISCFHGFSKHRSVNITMNGISSFSNRTLFIDIKPNAELEVLKVSLEEYFSSCTSLLIERDLRPFHPHITLATRDLRPANFRVAFDHFKSISFSDCFDLEIIALMKLADGKWNIVETIKSA